MSDRDKETERKREIERSEKKKPKKKTTTNKQATTNHPMIVPLEVLLLLRLVLLLAPFLIQLLLHLTREKGKWESEGIKTRGEKEENRRSQVESILLYLSLFTHLVSDVQEATHHIHNHRPVGHTLGRAVQRPRPGCLHGKVRKRRRKEKIY